MEKVILYSCLISFLLAILALLLGRVTNILRKRDKVLIVMITDDKYALQTAVAIKSIQKNKKRTTNLKIYVITHNLSDENKRLLSKMKCILKEAEIDKLLDEATIGQKRKTSLLKFYFPNIFSQEQKILYLDSDIIVQNDLAELFNKDLQEYYAAVAVDPLHFSEKVKKRLKLKKYFNSGVMLLNLEKMRKNNIVKKLVDYKINQGAAVLSDQNAFNVVFNENVVFFHPKYNWLVNYKEYIHNLSINEEIDIENAVIIHEAGKEKSWKNNETLAHDLWQKYYEKSPFKNVKRS